jgi:FtsZ-binding cell division protein ZapB
MKYFKYLASLPIVLSVLAATYGAINYTSKLTNQIDASTTTIALLKLEVENLEERIYGDIDNIHRTYTDKTGMNSKNYADAREELVKEMAEMSTWVGRLEGILYALRDGSYKLASQAEYQALEGLVRGNIESIREIGYDIKDIERVASGGY